MKAYQVHMYNAAVVPLSQNANPPAGNETKEFDDKQDAIEFAKSVRKTWDQVDVYQTQTNKVIVSFHSNNMYEGNKRTRLSEDE